MTRMRIVAPLAAILSLVLASVAFAASSSKVTGGTTQVTVTSAAAKVLSDNHITATVIAPATQSGATFTFPIRGGHLNVTKVKGVIRHSGGLKLTDGARTATLRDFTLVANGSRAQLWAHVRGSERRCRLVGRRHPHFHCRHVVIAKIADIRDGKVSGGSATGTLLLTSAYARVINTLAGSHIVSAGQPFATGKVTPTLA